MNGPRASRHPVGRLAALASAIAVLSACQATPTAPADSGAGGPTAGPGVSPSTGPAATGIDLPAGFPIGAGDYVLPDPANGLATLTSHRSTLSQSFDGITGGTATTWTWTVTYAASSEPAARIRTTARTGSDTAGDMGIPEPATAIQAAGSLFELDVDGNCTTSEVAGTAPSVIDPAAELGALIGATSAGSEALGSVQANVYTLDAPALGIMSDAQATGKVWVAAAGDYVVRYESSVTGGPDLFGEGVTGTLTTRYELVEANGAVTIDVPAACRAVTIELETPADATAVIAARGFFAYFTQASIADAVAAVKASALLAHWTPVGTDAIDVTIAHLEYEFDGHHLDVFVTSEDGGRYVQVVADAGGA